MKRIIVLITCLILIGSQIFAIPFIEKISGKVNSIYYTYSEYFQYFDEIKLETKGEGYYKIFYEKEKIIRQEEFGLDNFLKKTGLEKFYYDENSNLVEEERYDKEGELYNRNLYTYKEGRLIEEVRYHQKYKQKTIYTYDVLGRISHEEDFWDDVSIGKNTVIYDDSGRRIKLVSSDTTEEYIYDNKGQLVSKMTIENDIGSGKLTNEYEYDDRGNLIKDTSYFMGEIENRVCYVYDNDNNIIEVTGYWMRDILGKKELLPTGHYLYHYEYE